jgi:hypothetical protein
VGAELGAPRRSTLLNEKARDMGEELSGASH